MKIVVKNVKFQMGWTWKIEEMQCWILAVSIVRRDEPFSHRGYVKITATGNSH